MAQIGLVLCDEHWESLTNATNSGMGPGHGSVRQFGNQVAVGSWRHADLRGCNILLRVGAATGRSLFH